MIDLRVTDNKNRRKETYYYLDHWKVSIFTYNICTLLQLASYPGSSQLYNIEKLGIKELGYEAMLQQVL